MTLQTHSNQAQRPAQKLTSDQILTSAQGSLRGEVSSTRAISHRWVEVVTTPLTSVKVTASTLKRYEAIGLADSPQEIWRAFISKAL